MRYGYNSHGVFSKLSEILELEAERGNDITDIEDYFTTHGEHLVIWVCYSLEECLKNYCHDDEGYLLGSSSSKDLSPYYDKVFKVDLKELTLICGDSCRGYLYGYRI